MKFSKVFLASLLAVVVGGIATTLFFIFAGVGMVASLGSTPELPTPANSVLYINLNENIVDSPVASPLGTLNPETMTFESPVTLLGALTAIEKAATDPTIAGICIHQNGVGIIGGANLEELRQAILRFKESGKWVVAYDDIYTQTEYYLASVADIVMMHPYGSFELKGLASMTPFFKELLDRLDVKVEAIRPTVCKYKSAVEPYILNEMSPANREQMQALSDSMWEVFAGDIATSRSLDIERVKALAANLEVSLADEAEKAGLVDVVCYEDKAVEQMLALGASESDDHRLNKISLGEYVAKCGAPLSATVDMMPFSSKPTVAIIYAEGQIVDGAMEVEGYIYGSTLAEKLQRARYDENTKAVVLRVNSPGGSAIASDIVWREMVLLQREKPVVVSMGEMAASGGYYISAPADYIFADRFTLTGSIGVFGMIPDLSKALKNKLGVSFDTVGTSPSAGGLGMARGLTAAERAMFMRGVDEVYEVFTSKVAEGRNMEIEDVLEVAEGRVWSGAMATEIGLVDSYGGLTEAIAKAADMADLGSDFALYEFRSAMTPFDEWLSMLSSTSAKTLGVEPSMELREFVEENYRILNLSGIQTIMPFMEMKF